MIKSTITPATSKLIANDLAERFHNSRLRIYGTPFDWRPQTHPAPRRSGYNPRYYDPDDPGGEEPWEILEAGKYVSRLLAEFQVEVNRTAQSAIVLQPMNATILSNGYARYAKFFGKRPKSLITCSVGEHGSIQLPTSRLLKDGVVSIINFEINLNSY